MALALLDWRHLKFEPWPRQLEKPVSTPVRGKAVNFDYYPLINGSEADCTFAGEISWTTFSLSREIGDVQKSAVTNSRCGISDE